MLTFYRKYGRTAFDLFLIGLTIYLTMFIFSHIYEIAKPIFVGFVIYLLIEPFARLLNRLGLKKNLATTISMLLFIIIVVGIIVTLGVVFTTQIYQLSASIPKYIEAFKLELATKAEYYQGTIDAIPPELIETGKSYLIIIVEKSERFLISVLQYMFDSLTSVSSFIINFVFGLILAFFLSIEIDSWKRRANEKTPKTFKQAYYFLKENVIKGLTHYIKAQSKLISFTFLIVFTGLLLLGINNAFAISLLAALFDLLPVLGVSTVFVPWIIYLLIIGESTTALWLTLIWLIVIIFRQITEPKIMGNSLGVSAFTMLSFMVISLSLFGIAGIILSPILLILIKALYDQGYLKKWIHMPADEYEAEGEKLDTEVK